MNKQQVNEIIKKVVHRTINKKIAEQNINDQINKLMITETQSFSTDVYAVSEILYQRIAKSIENREGHYYNSTMISYADEQNQVQTVQVSYINYYIDVEEEMKNLCPIIHDVLAIAVQFPSYEAYLANAGEFTFKGSSDPNAKGLSVMFPIFEGKLNKHNVMPLIAHEVEHLYQYQMSVNRELPPPSVARKGLLASPIQLARSVTTTGGGRVSTSVHSRRSNGIIIVIPKVQRRVNIPVVDTTAARARPLTL